MKEEQRLISMVEIWKPVVGFETFYECSNLGRCRSLPREIIYKSDKKSRVGKWKGKILKPSKKEDGYLRYNLYINGKLKRYSAHRMVAQAFIPNHKNKRCVNHKDSNKSNNKVDNLEWVTDSENVLYSYQHGNRDKKFYGHCCVRKQIKLEKLISLKSLVLNHKPTRDQTASYAMFLDKKIKLSDFIACDLEGNVLEMPQGFHDWYGLNDDEIAKCEQYQEALNRVLFEGFEYLYEDGIVYIHYDGIYIEVLSKRVHMVSRSCNMSDLTIEDLVPLSPVLTASAIKQIEG